MITPERYKRMVEIFHRVCDLPPLEKAAYLSRDCGEDQELRQDIEKMLAADSTSLDSLTDLMTGEAVKNSIKRVWNILEEENRLKLPEKIGNCRILEKLGEDAAGTVYKAEQDLNPEMVALKVMHPESCSTDRLQRFPFDVEALALLHHPGIARILDAGIVKIGKKGKPSPFFIMEYVKGKPLLSYVNRTRMSLCDRMELSAMICDAVHHAHQKGVIHRDLKPANILVMPSGQPKILNFGIARSTESDLRLLSGRSKWGIFQNTVEYMSPEQAAGDARDIDTRSDIYSLGVIIYRLLADRLPYKIEDLIIPEAVQVIQTEQPAPLKTKDKGLIGDVETIVFKALEKDKEKRYASVADLGGDLRRHLNHEPLVARPLSAAYLLSMLARRNKALMIGVLGAFLALTAGLILTWILYLQAKHAEQDTPVDKDRTIEGKTT